MEESNPSPTEIGNAHVMVVDLNNAVDVDPT